MPPRGEVAAAAAAKLGLKARTTVDVGEHGAAHLGLGVFEGEVPVTRAGSSKAREFTAYPDLIEALLNGHARLSVQVSDGQHPSLIRGKKISHEMGIKQPCSDHSAFGL